MANKSDKDKISPFSKSFATKSRELIGMDPVNWEAVCHIIHSLIVEAEELRQVANVEMIKQRQKKINS